MPLNFVGGENMRKLINATATMFAAMLFILPLCACENIKTPTPAPTDTVTIESAYAQATELGYTGTLDEFIAMISGKDGIDGTDGVGIKSVELNANGELVITDTNDNVIFKKKLPLCDHKYSEPKIGILPACTSNGYNYAVCEKCGNVTYSPIEATGHDWDRGTVVFEPECVKNGLMYYTCLECGETKSQVIPATGEHKFEDNVCVYCNESYFQLLDDRYNGEYGYEYLSTLPSGAKLCRLYDAIDEHVMQFHSDGAQSATASGDNYILADIDYAALGLDDDQAVSVWKTYTDDNPLYYWLSKTLLVQGEKIILCVEPEYVDGATRTEYNRELYSLIDEYAAIAPNESAYTVALAYHDEIVERIDYAYKNGTNTPETAAWAHNITGVLEETGAVCEGYARTFQLLLNVRNIPNMLVTGTSRNESHAWNLVRLDDEKWYWYDLTWDDTPRAYFGTSHNYTCAVDAEFLKNHTVASSDEFGVDFLYELPARAETSYSGDEIMLYDTFDCAEAQYTVVGYDSVSFSFSSKVGAIVIPETVEYDDREFTVVSIARYRDGSPSGGNVFDYDTACTSLHIPSTVLYLDEYALSGIESYVTNITVDADNPKFTALDGVLFSKNLFTLICYPSANARTEYSIPDETYYIAKQAFRSHRNTKLEALHIGKHVMLAGWANWWGCGYPTQQIGGNVISGEWSKIFYALTGKKQVTIAPENTHYSIIDGMFLSAGGTHLVAGLPDAERIVMPDTVTSIGNSPFNNYSALEYVKFSDGIKKLDSTFYYNANLTEVVLPSGLEKICSDAFIGCRSLQALHIPKSVNKIEAGAISDCYELTELTVDPENTAYTVTNGCLIEKATKTLISALIGFELPTDGSITIIADEAFRNCAWREQMDLVIPDGVTDIGRNLFDRTPRAIVLPASVTRINAYTFFNAYIYYAGTEETWNDITVDGSAPVDKDRLYFYSETQPTTDGNYWHYVDGAAAAW